MEMATTVFGGIGLFLLGMTLMTDGLKALAGDSLKQLLGKFTGGYFASVLSGAVVTLIIQSSSATILMMIGFVSAGLLTFSQSIGVVIGANVGTTSTGWIVSLIGFKLNMGMISSFFIGIGAFFKFFSRGRFSPHGLALAGFGLIFFGIDLLQTGMAGVTENVRLDTFSDPTFFQMLLVVFVGIVLTIIMQSSSAMMVVTLSALAAGAISFEHAAALVIGQNVGTTFSAIVAAIGASVHAKRTAWTHTVFNLIVGAMAFLSLPLLQSSIFAVLRVFGSDDESIALAIFNTLLPVIGAILFAPFLPNFIKWMERLIPDRSDKMTKYLDPSVASIMPIALEAVRRTLMKVTKVLIGVGAELFMKKRSEKIARELEEANAALGEARKFLSLMNEEPAVSTKQDYERQVALVHVVDHLGRLIKAFEESNTASFSKLDDEGNLLVEKIAAIFYELDRLSDEEVTDFVEKAETYSKTIADLRKENRKVVFETTVLSQSDVDEAIETVRAIHWMDRIAYHLWRSLHHLKRCKEDTIEEDRMEQDVME